MTNDWISYLVIDCEDRAHALRLESFIKKMKARKFIESIKLNPNKLNDIVLKEMH